MLLGRKKRMVVGLGFLSLCVLFNLGLVHLLAAEPIVGTWNYSTSNHWVKGPVPAGKPSKGEVVITQSGGQLKMEFKSGMVFNPPQLKYFEGKKKIRIIFFPIVQRWITKEGSLKIPVL